MKKIIIGVVVLALLTGGAYFAFGMNAPVAQPAVAAAPPAAAAKAVVAEAKVVPLHSAALSLPIGGMVAEVLVGEGDQVMAGQVIARLDATQLQARVAGAKAALAAAPNPAAARKFVAFVLSPAGQAVLAKHGFAKP